MNISAIMRRPGILCARKTDNKLYKSLLIRQLMRISILTTIILIATFHLLLAIPVSGQDMTVEKVSVGLKEQPLESAIKQIEQQTTLRFFYRRSEINTLNKLSLSNTRRTIEQTLYALLQNTNFSFRQIDQNILIEVNDQPVYNKRTVTGFVYSSDTKTPVKYAIIEILRKKDLQLAGQTYTDSTGRFTVTTTDNADHLLRVSLLGYHIYSTEISSAENLTVPPVYLQPDTKELKEVIIAARSPLVKQEVDRLTYNVQADPENKFNSLLEMLRKVPLITVDADDNVKLKGSSSFKVLIDGHSTSLVVNDPKEIFRSMAASNILRIEVITIPPAKYDGEGLAGIINIITVKKIKDGYSGNAGLLYKFPNGPRGNAGINYKSGKFALSAITGVTEINTPQTNYSIHREGIDPSGSVTDQTGTAHTGSKNGYLSTQMSYEIDSLNLVAIILGYNAGNNNRFSSAFTRQTDSLTHSYKLDDDGHGHQHGYDLGLDYQLGFKRNKAQLLSLSYRFSSSKNYQLNALNASEQVNYNISDYDQNNNGGTNEHTVQLDYTHPLKHVDIEGGVKGIFRNYFSDYTIGVANPNGSVLTSVDNSDSFNYQQNIYSIYNSYQLNLDKWTIKGGLRLERTDINADFSTGPVTIPDYNNLLPSLAVQRKLSQASSINFGYTDRIKRPGIQQLNPYIDQQNPNFITFGNPNLKPETNHTISLGYGLYKNTSITAGLTYMFSNNTIQYVSSLGADGITRGTYNNLGTNKNLQANLNVNYPISQRLNLNLSTMIGFVQLKGTADSTFYNRKAMTGNCILYLNYRLDHGWSTGFLFQYYSPGITLQGTTSPYYYTSLSLSKSVFNKKLNINGSASNPYQKYLNFRSNTTDPHFTQAVQNYIVYRRFNLGVNYAFGKLREGSIKKNKKTVSNDDIKNIPNPIPNN